MGCAGSRTRKVPKMHMVAKGSPVKIIAALEDWPAKFEIDNDGRLEEDPKALEALKKVYTTAMEKLDDLVLDMCAENPCPTEKEHLVLYKKFVKVQQKLLKQMSNFDNDQHWCPTELIESGAMRSTDTKILRGGTTSAHFLTNKGDKYSVQYTDATSLEVHAKARIIRPKLPEGKSDEVIREDITLERKAGLQQPRRIESGIPRGRVVFYDWHPALVDDQDPDEAGVHAYPDPAEVFGPAYAEKDVCVQIQDQKFAGDARAPEFAGGCCAGPRKHYYKYEFNAGTKKHETMYLYEEP